MIKSFFVNLITLITIVILIGVAASPLFLIGLINDAGHLTTSQSVVISVIYSIFMGTLAVTLIEGNNND